MRTLQDIENAKNSLYNKQNINAIYTPPPGYIKGFKLEVNAENQLTVGKGICNIRGKRVVNNSLYYLNGEDFTVSNIQTDNYYYIYINDNGKFLIDVLEGAWDDDGYGYYHPTNWPYRYLGSFYYTSDKTYTKIFNQDAIDKYSIKPEAIDTLLSEFSRVSVGRNAVQTLTMGNWDVVQFDTTNYDLQGDWDGVNFLFTAPADGYYLVSGVLTSATHSWISGEIMVNGMFSNGTPAAAVGMYKSVEANFTGNISLPFTNVFYCAAGNYIQIKCFTAVSWGSVQLLNATLYNNATFQRIG